MEENSQHENLCEICGVKANNLCFKCVMILCDSCYEFIHNKEKNKNHKKEKIENFSPFTLKCPAHPKERINLFCSDEKGKLYYFAFLF